jgi:energy-coupling factor transport system ATP-binding protein
MAIEVKDLTFAYPKSNNNALEHISVIIEKGEKVAIIGQNGAGKSTMVKTIDNIYKPTTGQIIIDGKDTAKMTTAQTAKMVGYVFQNPNDQIFNDNVVKEIEYVLRYWKLPEEEIIKRREEVLDITGIRPYIDIHPFDIPLPIRKFLTVAVVLAVDPDYVILDEPTAGQDNWGRNQLKIVMDYLQAKGKAIITISHDMEFVAENFNRVIVMAHKNIIADDDRRKIFYQQDILKDAKVKPPVSAQIAQALGLSGNILNMDELVRAL